MENYEHNQLHCRMEYTSVPWPVKTLKILVSCLKTSGKVKMHRNGQKHMLIKLNVTVEKFVSLMKTVSTCVPIAFNLFALEMDTLNA